MAVTPKSIADGSLTGSLVTILTVTTNTTTSIRSATFCNTTGAPVNLTVVLNPRTAGTNRVVVDNRTLADEETYNAPEMVNQILEGGGVVQASGNGIEYYISGTEVT
jgi:hypothetical protein